MQYEIDVNEQNAKELRNELEPFTSHARRTGGSKTQATVVKDFDPKAIRRWAEANDIEVSDRGRIAFTVVEQFKAAGN